MSQTPDAAAPAIPTRRPIRFGLRTLLAIFAIIAALLALLVWEMNRYRHQAEARSHFERLGL